MDPLEQDNIVLIKDDNVLRNNWRLARVISVTQDTDKLVPKVSAAVGDPNLTSKGKRLGTTTVLVQKLMSPNDKWRPGIPHRRAKTRSKQACAMKDHWKVKRLLYVFMYEIDRMTDY